MLVAERLSDFAWHCVCVFYEHLQFFHKILTSRYYFSNWQPKSCMTRDDYVYGSCQWEATLQCNVISHWQGAYSKWSLMTWCLPFLLQVNWLRPEWNCDIYKYFSFNENIQISIKVSLQSVYRSLIIEKSALVWVVAWCQTGTKPLPEPMLNKSANACMCHKASMK